MCDRSWYDEFAELDAFEPHSVLRCSRPVFPRLDIGVSLEGPNRVLVENCRPAPRSMSGLDFERELRGTECWSVCIEGCLDPPRMILPELNSPIAVGAARKVSGANRNPKAEEDIPARHPGMGV